MKVLFFDTETSGFPQKNKQFNDPSQPWAVQIAAVLKQDDHEIAVMNALISSEGREISKGAEKVHGISKEKCDQYGIKESSALNIFNQMMQEADLIVAHNIYFDKQILMCIAARCNNQSTFDLFKEKKAFCTMLNTTEYCELPGRFGKYKWPKLEELYGKLYGESFEAHDALEDVKATIRCFKHPDIQTIL